MIFKRLRLLSFSIALVAFSFLTTAASAQLLIDFNSLTQSGGPHPQAGYQTYDAGHEVTVDFDTKYYVATLVGEEVEVSVTPAWPNTADNRVQQMIDRGDGNDANWLGDDIDLITDFLGIDSRPGNGGNGDWIRSDEFSTPTYMTLTLGGLPEGDYEWLSLHHDTEHVWADFQVEISTDGGVTYTDPVDQQMTDSTVGGSPDSLVVYQGDVDPDPRLLPSTFSAEFTADGDEDVVFRFAPFADDVAVDGTGVHKQIFGMNAFELTGSGGPVGASFLRGDADASGAINITDGIFILNFLFLGGPNPPCGDAADSDDSNAINITDGIYVLNFLFLGGPNPKAPYPDCGVDKDDDAEVNCETSHPNCGV